MCVGDRNNQQIHMYIYLYVVPPTCCVMMYIPFTSSEALTTTQWDVIQTVCHFKISFGFLLTCNSALYCQITVTCTSYVKTLDCGCYIER